MRRWQADLEVLLPLESDAEVRYRFTYHRLKPVLPVQISIANAYSNAANAEEKQLQMLDVLQEANFVQGVAQFHFDQGLAPYNLQAYSSWQSLAGYIDQPTISRCVRLSL